MTTTKTRMTRWTNERLEKELFFAEASEIAGDPETTAWTTQIRAEIERRANG